MTDTDQDLQEFYQDLNRRTILECGYGNLMGIYEVEGYQQPLAPRRMVRHIIDSEDAVLAHGELRRVYRPVELKSTAEGLDTLAKLHLSKLQLDELLCSGHVCVSRRPGMFRRDYTFVSVGSGLYRGFGKLL